MPKILLILLFGSSLIISSDCFSQNSIILRKGSNNKTIIKYEIGDSITYKTSHYNFFLTDMITEIKDDIIVLSENVIQPTDIVSIDIRDKDPRNHTLQNLTLLSYGAGVIFLLAEGVNSIYHDGRFSINKGILISSGLLLGTGFVLSKLRYRYFKNRGKNRIQLFTQEVEF